MNRMLVRLAAGVAAPLLWPAAAQAQPIDALGTRAAGMGGAYVAVADDASAAYWNPAGFATGSYFSLVLDRGGAKADPRDGERAGSRSAFLIALGAPAFGLSYYRLRSTTLAPADGRARDPHDVQLDTLITHHTGATLVQSVASGVAVGATIKLVRGIASSGVVPDVDRDALLDEGSDLVGKASNKLDADVGVMATLGQVKAGLTIRNVRAPSFESAGLGTRLKLERQARAGVAVRPVPGVLISADADLLRTSGPLGDTRDVAVGAEGRMFRRGFIRGGVRVNAAGSDSDPSLSLGGSYAVRASFLVDAQLTGGSDRVDHGWGISARLVY